MSDESAKESGQEQQEVQGQPTLEVPSVASGVQQTSGSQNDEAVLERLLSRVDERLDRKMQSLKDKRIAELEKKINMLLDEGESAPVREVSGRTKQADQSGGEDHQPYMEAMTAQILRGADIAFDDPDYVALVNEYGQKITNPDQWEKVVREFANNKKVKGTKQSNVTPAAMSSSGSSPPPGQRDTEKVASELMKVQRALARKMTPDLLDKQAKLVKELNELDPMVNLDDPDVVADTSALHEYF